MKTNVGCIFIILQSVFQILLIFFLGLKYFISFIFIEKLPSVSRPVTGITFENMRSSLQYISTGQQIHERQLSLILKKQTFMQ